MHKRGISARELSEHLHRANERATSEGRPLSEGAARVLRKLVRDGKQIWLHRTYKRTGGQLALSDLMSDGDLARHGYIPRNDESIAIAVNDPIHRDRILCWASESDGVAELWVGERLRK